MLPLKNDPMRSHLLLITFGIASLVFYICLTALSRQFNWGEGYADRPILIYLAIYFALFALYALACKAVIQKTDSTWPMIAIVQRLLKYLPREEVMRLLGMQGEEVDRLSLLRATTDVHGEADGKLSEAWIPEGPPPVMRD